MPNNEAQRVTSYNNSINLPTLMNLYAKWLTQIFNLNNLLCGMTTAP